MPTTRSSTLFALLTLASFVTAAPSSAAVATALLREGGALPGGPVGNTINALSNTAVNHAGGYSATVNSTDGVTTLSHVWGSATGGPGSVLRTEGTFGSLVQTAFEAFFGMSNAGNVCYSPTGTGGPVGSFDSVFLDDTPLAVEGDPMPSLPGQFWRFASRPGVTGDGQPHWVGGTTSTQGGSTENYGLFFGVGGSVVLLGGQAVPDLPFPLAMVNAVGFDYRFAGTAATFIAPVVMASGSTANNDAIVMNGSGLLVDGSLVREQALVPPSVGGVGGERWFAFDFMGITDLGGWFVTGDTDGPTTSDEFVLARLNQLPGHPSTPPYLLYREGQTIDGGTLTGDIEGAYMNAQSNLALIWDVVGPTAALEALVVDGKVRLVEGDLVDLDGDGVVEPNSRLADFTGISSLTMSDLDPAMHSVKVYFTADVDVNGTTTSTDDIEGFFCLEVQTDDPTATLAALVSSRATRDRVEVVWSVAAGTRATVYRATDGASWTVLGSELADGSGFLRVVDDDVIPGGRYGYRLGFASPSGEVLAGETYVTIPLTAGLALGGAYPNPASGPAFNVSFALADAAPARLELLDVGGRCVAAREVGSLGPGAHVVSFATEASRLPAGLYVIRLDQGGSVLTRKAAIVR